MTTKTAILTNKKTTRTMLYRDGRFGYKLNAATAIMAVIISALIVDLVGLSALKNSVDQWLINNPDIIKGPNFGKEFNLIFEEAKNKDGLSISTLSPYSSQMDYGGFIIAHFSYFTVLSNLTIGIGFLGATVKFNKEGKTGYLGYRPTVILATFITITMLIGLGLLMPTNLASGHKMNAIEGFYGLTEHALFPLLFIVYVVFTFKTEAPVMNQKDYMKKEGKNIIFILIIYGAYCLIRGEIRYQGNAAPSTQYPYFFFQIHDTKINGLAGGCWFVLAILIISTISFGFSISYNAMIIRKLKREN